MSTHRNIPEDSHLQIRRRENLKPHHVVTCIRQFGASRPAVRGRWELLLQHLMWRDGYVPTAYDHHTCINNSFIAESLESQTRGSLWFYTYFISLLVFWRIVLHSTSNASNNNSWRITFKFLKNESWIETDRRIRAVSTGVLTPRAPMCFVRPVYNFVMLWHSAQ
jgi:hypothetical protein